MTVNAKAHLRGILIYSGFVALAMIVISGLFALVIWLSGTPPPSSIDSLAQTHSVGTVIGVSALIVIIIPVLLVEILHAPAPWDTVLDCIVLALFWGAALYWMVTTHRTIKEVRRLKKLGLLPTQRLSSKEEYDRILAQAREQEKTLSEEQK